MTTGEIDKGYVLDSTLDAERKRLEAFGRLYNPGTINHLRALGVDEGWKVLDVGAGTGQVTSWLSERVGPAGQVVATDLDTRFLEILPERDNVDIRRHNIVEDPIEADAYDLVTARLLLEHLPERERVLGKLISALKPGGWLLVEDFDFRTWGFSVPQKDLNALVGKAGTQLFAFAGADTGYGTKLPYALASSGLVELGNEGRIFATPTGLPEMDGVYLLLHQVKDKLVATKLMTADEVDAAIEEVATPSDSFFYWPIMVAAWGRKKP